MLTCVSSLLGLGRVQHSRLRGARAAAPQVHGRAAGTGAPEVHDQLAAGADGGPRHDGAEIQVNETDDRARRIPRMAEDKRMDFGDGDAHDAEILERAGSVACRLGVLARDT